MSGLAEVIAARQVTENSLAIYWLCQAGFVFKSATNQIVYIDPYFSDVVERVVGFKRMMACPITAPEVTADLIVCTHEHLDHMDTDALGTLAADGKAHFAGPIECMREFERQRIPSGRCHLLEEGKSFSFGDLIIRGVYADHGELAPDALGVVLEFGNIRVYHTGDTAFRAEEFQAALSLKPDILLPCINGAFGNLNAEEAAQLTQMAAPALVIPTHFWMFVEQNGDPRQFLARCGELAPKTRALLLKPGEEFLFEKS
jgi:L-ascorbate 6-phosphate lactonase